jgi:hypothetical protein
MELGFTTLKTNTKNFFINEKWILVVMLLLFLERLIVMAQLGVIYTIYCIIKTDEVAKKFPQFCNDDFLIIAKGH